MVAVCKRMPMTHLVMNCNSGVVDEDIDSLMFFLQMVPECLDCVFLGDVKFVESDFVSVGRPKLLLQLFYSFMTEIFISS